MIVTADERKAPTYPDKWSSVEDVPNFEVFCVEAKPPTSVATISVGIVVGYQLCSHCKSIE